MNAMVAERELAFQLYEVLHTETLLNRSRYAEHSKEVFDATLATARRIAAEHFAPHYQKGDRHEPLFEGGTVRIIPEVASAWNAFAGAGFLSAHWDVDEGGVQLPEVVLRTAMTCFFTANVATAGYPFLTIGVANLLRVFGTGDQKRRYLAALGDGRSSGTMALTEPGQGSSLGDIKTTAAAQPDGSYLITGQKMFISGGDQDFADNIVHMVLARVRGAPPDSKGLSLFLVPKRLANDDGSLGDRNDVALAGLLHKMGWRSTTSTVLSFGEKGGATGFLLGRENHGLAHMFQMMNEARIGVGLIAACLAYRGFSESLAYARDRVQGRLSSAKSPLSGQVRIIDHADVRRLLVAQKAYSEGSLALCLYASSLFEDQHTHPDAPQRERAGLLLDVLTPVVKSWPAKYGCAANEMAIQVLGGSGYTCEFPVEQLYRDQRLNPIHEGAEAIHGLELLGRKVSMKDGAAFALFCTTVSADAQRAGAQSQLREYSQTLQIALDQLASVTTQLVILMPGAPDLALANANAYLDVFGSITVAWMWLNQAEVACRALSSDVSCEEQDFYLGKIQTARYYFQRELPIALTHIAALKSIDRTYFDMQDRWFQ